MKSLIVSVPGTPAKEGPDLYSKIWRICNSDIFMYEIIIFNVF